MEDKFDLLDKLFQQKFSDFQFEISEQDWLDFIKKLEATWGEEIIKEKLETYATPYSSWDWYKMQEQLDAVTLDASIHEKLSTDSPHTEVPDWQDFSELWESRKWEMEISDKLSSHKEESTPDFDAFEKIWNDKQIDAQFQKLHQYESPLELASWTEFYHNLPNIYFDNQIRTKLEEHSFPLTPYSWSQFLHRNRNKNEWKWVVPFLLLLGLVGGGIGIYWMKQGASPMVPQKIATTSHPAENSAHQRASDIHHTPEITPNPATPIQAEYPHTNKPNEKKHSRLASPILKPIHTNNQAQTHSPISPRPLAAASTPIPVIGGASPASTTLPHREQASDTSFSTNIIPAISTPISQPNSSILVGVQPKPTPSLSFYQAKPRRPIMEIPSKDNHDFHARWELYGIVLGSLAELKDTLHQGYGLGLRVEIPLWEGGSLASGAISANKNFASTYYKYSEYHQIARKHLLMGNVQSLDFMFLLKQRAPIAKNWNVYLQAGVAPSITLSENYTHYDPTAAPNIGMPDESLARMTPTQTKVHFQPYIGNIMVGTGVEWQKNWFYLGAEPTFQWGVQKLSHSEKRIHSLGFALRTGVELGRRKQPKP